MINFTRDRLNLLIPIEHNVNGIGVDSDGIKELIVVAEMKTSPRQLFLCKDFLNMFLGISNVHAQNRKIRFRMFLHERPPGCVKAFAGGSPVAKEIDQDNFAFEFFGGYWLALDVSPLDGGERRTDFQLTVERDLFWLATDKDHQQ